MKHMKHHTGSKSVVCNVWSEEAREASAAARAGRSNKAIRPGQREASEQAGSGNPDKAEDEHREAYKYHKAMAGIATSKKEKMAHRIAADAHYENAENYSDAKTEAASRSLSVEANKMSDSSGNTAAKNWGETRDPGFDKDGR